MDKEGEGSADVATSTRAHKRPAMSLMDRPTTTGTDSDSSLPRALDKSWRRLGLVFYNDHNSEYFHRATRHLIRDTLMSWYHKYGFVYDDDDEDDDEDDDDGSDHSQDSDSRKQAKASNDPSKPSPARIRAIESVLGIRDAADNDFHVTSYESRHTNEFGITVGRFNNCFVSVKLPATSCVDGLERTIVLVYSESKNWDLPLSAGLLSGDYTHYKDLPAIIKENDWIDPSDRSKEKDDAYMQALRDLQCDKVAILWSGAGSDWCYGSPVGRESPCFCVDTDRAFKALMGDVLKPEESLRWTKMWRTWKGGYDDDQVAELVVLPPVLKIA